MPLRASYIIGHSHPAFIIAEAGVNHNGDIKLAHDLIDVAAKAGADAVKFQTFKAETLVSPKAQKAEYQKQTTGSGSQFEMLKALELADSAWAELREHCEGAGVMFISTPFDEASADLLIAAGVDVIKLGSGELTNRPLIEHCARSGLPVILSTGMGSRKEVGAAVSWFRLAFANGQVAHAQRRVSYEDGGRIGLLHCVSSYPAPLEVLNLRAIATLRRHISVPVGFSDHSPGLEAVSLAIAAGACMIEKHFTLDRNLSGPDHRASLEPGELAEMIRQIRHVEKVLGSGRKEPHEMELGVRDVARKSVVALHDIKKGSVVQTGDVGIRRPGSGLPPSRLNSVIGCRALRDIEAGEPLRPEWVDFPEGAT